MSGIYEYKSGPDRPPTTIPVGALGDISSALFGVIGILAALRHRDRTGLGQYVDIAMFDSMLAMTDIVTNFWSMGIRPDNQVPRAVRGVPGRRRLRGASRWCASPSSPSWPNWWATPSGPTIRASPIGPAGCPTSTT